MGATQLHQTGDETEATKRAEKLVKKYGEEAMREKAEKKARKERNKSVSCTGSKIRCSTG